MFAHGSAFCLLHTVPLVVTPSGVLSASGLDPSHFIICVLSPMSTQSWPTRLPVAPPLSITPSQSSSWLLQASAIGFWPCVCTRHFAGLLGSVSQTNTPLPPQRPANKQV